MVFALRGFAGKPGTTFFRQFHCRKHCFRRTRLYCSNCGENGSTLRITNLIYSRKSGGSVSLPVFLSSAARRGKGISDSAAADVIASNAPLREGSHKVRQNGPKHYPRGFKGIAIPLARLSPLSFAVQRKMEPPEVASCRTRPVKTQNKKTTPPEGLP